MKLVFPVLDDTPHAGCTAPSLLTPLLKVHCNIQHLSSSGVGNVCLHFILKISSIDGHAVALLDQICSYTFNTATKSDVNLYLSSQQTTLMFLRNVQGEHKNTPLFQVVIKSKLTGIFLQNWWLQLHKLIQFHVVSHTQCAPPLVTRQTSMR